MKIFPEGENFRVEGDVYIRKLWLLLYKLAVICGGTQAVQPATEWRYSRQTSDVEINIYHQYKTCHKIMVSLLFISVTRKFR